MLKADEDKTDLGAFVAAPADPWGQSMPATSRRMPARRTGRCSPATATRRSPGCSPTATWPAPGRWSDFLFDRAQQPTGASRATPNSNGSVAPDTYGLYEIDEDAYPLLMAWEAGFAGDVAFYEEHLRPDADFIVDHGPAYGEERWEEHTGYSPSTIAAEIAGLVAAAHLAQAAGDPARALLYLATADDYQRNVKSWTVTATGPYATIATSSVCRRPVIPTPPRPTTSTTAA